MQWLPWFSHTGIQRFRRRHELPAASCSQCVWELMCKPRASEPVPPPPALLCRLQRPSNKTVFPQSSTQRPRHLVPAWPQKHLAPDPREWLLGPSNCLETCRVCGARVAEGARGAESRGHRCQHGTRMVLWDESQEMGAWQRRRERLYLGKGAWKSQVRKLLAITDGAAEAVVGRAFVSRKWRKECVMIWQMRVWRAWCVGTKTERST